MNEARFEEASVLTVIARPICLADTLKAIGDTAHRVSPDVRGSTHIAIDPALPEYIFLDEPRFWASVLNLFRDIEVARCTGPLRLNADMVENPPAVRIALAPCDDLAHATRSGAHEAAHVLIDLTRCDRLATASDAWLRPLGPIDPL